MADRANITPELCRQLLSYDPETGRLFWKVRPISMFRDVVVNGGFRSAQAAADSFNVRFAGKEAFTAHNEAGYKVGAIHAVNFRAHRVVWAIVRGEWPTHQIDHQDGDRTNNRIGNLRCANNQQNHTNEGISANNTSGFTGVVWCKQTGKWRAMIKVNRRNIHLGRFVRYEDAVSARQSANLQYGFHTNHGLRPAWMHVA